jgi:hypothetical protein
MLTITQESENLDLQIMVSLHCQEVFDPFFISMMFTLIGIIPLLETIQMMLQNILLCIDIIDCEFSV